MVAIRRQDAERLGYDNAENWRALVNASLCDIAKGYKIHPDHLRWYAAFHEKEKRVHIHMVIFSTAPKEGYLTQDGIRQVKSAFARRIFRQDLMHVYEQKTAYRNQLQQNAAEAMQELIRQMRDGTPGEPAAGRSDRGLGAAPADGPREKGLRLPAAGGEADGGRDRGCAGR